MGSAHRVGAFPARFDVSPGCPPCSKGKKREGIRRCRGNRFTASKLQPLRQGRLLWCRKNRWRFGDGRLGEAVSLPSKHTLEICPIDEVSSSQPISNRCRGVRRTRPAGIGKGALAFCCGKKAARILPAFLPPVSRTCSHDGKRPSISFRLRSSTTRNFLAPAPVLHTHNSRRRRRS
jgi:hypothetical protein